MTRLAVLIIMGSIAMPISTMARAQDKAASSSDAATATAASTMLWYAQPAAKWEQALPVGNGRLGAMVFGGTTEERIQLNEDSVWSGGPEDADNPESIKSLATIRQLLFAGKYAEAQKLTDQTQICKP